MIESAIIGYWRCGATMDEVIEATNLTKGIILSIIIKYISCTSQSSQPYLLPPSLVFIS